MEQLMENFAENMEKDLEKKGDYKKVEYGKYIVEINNMEYFTTKTEKDCIKVDMKIVEGKSNGQHIFYNQLIDTQQKLRIFNSSFLMKLVPKEKQENFDFIHLETFNDFINLMDKVYDFSKDYQYQLDYKQSEKNKDFDVYKIEEPFVKQTETPDDDYLPFE